MDDREVRVGVGLYYQAVICFFFLLFYKEIEGKCGRMVGL